MKDKKYKRAVAFMCAAVIAAVLLGGVRTVSSSYRKAVDTFGAMQDGVSAETTLGSLVGNASNLCTVAARYDLKKSLISDFEGCISRAQAAEDMKEIRASVTELCNQSRVVFDALETQPLTDADKTYRTELFYNIRSCYAVLCKSDYNTAAGEHNALCSRLPASFFAAICGRGRLPVFTAQDVILEDNK